MEALRTPERLLVVEQQGDAPAGVLGEWAAARGIEVDVVRPRSGEELPAPARLQAVAVLGSDASVHATREPWVAREVDWLRDVVAAGVPVLGLCFGAQALAAAMGGEVARLPRPEIGWIRVDGAAGAVSPGPWFAWHEDGFTVPPRRPAARAQPRRSAGLRGGPAPRPAVPPRGDAGDRRRVGGVGGPPARRRGAGPRARCARRPAAGRPRHGRPPTSCSTPGWR